MSKEKILHLQWNVEDIINNLDQIKSCGWTAILTNPVQISKEEISDLWYMKYQTLGLSIGNRYGSKKELIELCNKAHDKGLNIYTDIIVTHVGNAGKDEKELIPHEDVDERLVNNPYFWKEKKRINYGDRYSETHHCNSLPAIRLDNYQYQDLVINFLNELIDIGFDGIRLDSAKMIPTPEENFGENKNDFLERVFKRTKKPLYVFGEVLFSSKEMIDRYEKYINVLTEFNKEKSYNLNKEATIFFRESHDSYLDELIGYTKNLESDEIINDYEKIVKDFNKVLFYARPFDNSWCSDKIKQINNTYR